MYKILLYKINIVLKVNTIRISKVSKESDVSTTRGPENAKSIFYFLPDFCNKSVVSEFK
jgi:hypothetical protein